MPRTIAGVYQGYGVEIKIATLAKILSKTYGLYLNADDVEMIDNYDEDRDDFDEFFDKSREILEVIVEFFRNYPIVISTHNIPLTVVRFPCCSGTYRDSYSKVALGEFLHLNEDTDNDTVKHLANLMKNGINREKFCSIFGNNNQPKFMIIGDDCPCTT